MHTTECRDIKPQNILIACGQDKPRVLISDFGLCRKMTDGQESYNKTANALTAGGTSGWRAPEVIIVH